MSLGSIWSAIAQMGQSQASKVVSSLALAWRRRPFSVIIASAYRLLSTRPTEWLPVWILGDAGLGPWRLDPSPRLSTTDSVPNAGSLPTTPYSTGTWGGEYGYPGRQPQSTPERRSQETSRPCEQGSRNRWSEWEPQSMATPATGRKNSPSINNSDGLSQYLAGGGLANNLRKATNRGLQDPACNRAGLEMCKTTPLDQGGSSVGVGTSHQRNTLVGEAETRSHVSQPWPM
ncbi:hypothetical protein LZ30DRAFT_686953 [Colletotrichum cereale]|nr:hypothetical protein LZ30DRAFT_686953 [Colletotrichum cereale]